MKIFGAGLAGLLAGVTFQNASILEPLVKKRHQALLRFRSPQIGEAVGIPFKKVQVYKGIWVGKDVPISPRWISQYARKVSNKIAYRSICNVSEAERWIAPADFQEQLEEMCRGRIEYNVGLQYHLPYGHKIISTIPIHALAKMLDIPVPDEEAADPKVKSIYVNRYRIYRCDVYMTYYYPGFNTSVYRASISGDELIIESTREATEKEIDKVIESMGLKDLEMDEILVNYEQKNGKISPISEEWRKEFILNATLQHDIYSLGRFATWKNLVLDDVYHDVLRIKEFINRDKYDHHKDFNI